MFNLIYSKMEEKIKKETRPENEAFKERYQFLLEVNDFTICQRYFKVNDFIKGSIQTVEFTNTMENIVSMLKSDLERKSRIYQWYTANLPLKLTGFKPDFVGEPEYIYSENETTNETYDDVEELKPYDVTFKLTFLIDEKPVYTRIWDGTVYPKYVRNSVDLLNYCPNYTDVLSLNFKQMLKYKMSVGEPDLTYKMIKMVYDTISGKPEEKTFTTITNYKNVENGVVKNEVNYKTITYNKEYIDGWREYTKKKTADYFKGIGLNQPQTKKK